MLRIHVKQAMTEILIVIPFDVDMAVCPLFPDLQISRNNASGMTVLLSNHSGAVRRDIKTGCGGGRLKYNVYEVGRGASGFYKIIWMENTRNISII